MLLFRFMHIVIILVVIKHFCCDRRISKGRKLENLKSYLVYLVHSDQSPTKYQGWTCAGALVHSLYVVTAAACLEDVHNLYVIAGYAKMVKQDKLDNDTCTTNSQTHKRKVIQTCIPKSYELDYSNVEKWSYIDIGVAKIKRRLMQYQIYKEICTHVPIRVPINFNPAYQSPGIDAMVMGWGHISVWRQPGDKRSYIQEYARYASVRIMDKKKCKEYYKNYPELQKTIDKHMICTMEKGNIDSAGVANWTHPDFQEECNEDGQYCRRNFNENSEWNISTVSGRRQGFCQNDHGAPLITWIGGKEHLIGVASVFRVNKEGKCAGPYLFTSTQCNGIFLHCVLQEYLYKDHEHDHRRSSMCKLPARERGFEMIYKYANWMNETHRKRRSRKRQRERFTSDTKQNNQRTTKTSSIYNEDIRIRPQISIRNFNRNIDNKHIQD